MLFKLVVNGSVHEIASAAEMPLLWVLRDLFGLQPSAIGAILLTGYLGGSVITHLRVGNPLFTHALFGVYLGILLWGGLYLRNERLRALIALH